MKKRSLLLAIIACIFTATPSIAMQSFQQGRQDIAQWGAENLTYDNLKALFDAGRKKMSPTQLKAFFSASLNRLKNCATFTQCSNKDKLYIQDLKKSGPAFKVSRDEVTFQYGEL